VKAVSGGRQTKCSERKLEEGLPSKSTCLHCPNGHAVFTDHWTTSFLLLIRDVNELTFRARWQEECEGLRRIVWCSGVLLLPESTLMEIERPRITVSRWPITPSSAQKGKKGRNFFRPFDDFSF
jgi:hypothetical protein